MPEINPGVAQGEILPIYLAIRTMGGQLVPQPVGHPTIEITYIDPDTHVRVQVVRLAMMSEIEPGRYFYIWRVPEDEPTVTHTLLLRGIIDEALDVATDQTYAISDTHRNPTFTINVDVIDKLDNCYPEVMCKYPKCRTRRLCDWVRDFEADIGLDDRRLEGTFRYGEFPDQVVDRRAAARFEIRFFDPRDQSGIYIHSDLPGGGPAQRPQAPPSRNMRYRDKYRYK